MSASNPNNTATATQPQSARRGNGPVAREVDTWLKKVEKGRAPSREKAQAWRLRGGRLERPIRYWFVTRRLMRPIVGVLPRASW